MRKPPTTAAMAALFAAAGSKEAPTAAPVTPQGSTSQRPGTTRLGYAFGHLGAAHFAASLFFCELTAQQILGGCGIFPKDKAHVLVVEIPEDKAEAMTPLFEHLANKAAENFATTLAARQAEVKQAAAPRVILSS